MRLSLPDQRDAMRATLKHELGHAVVGDDLGLVFGGIRLDNKLPDEDEFPTLAAMGICMLGGETQFAREWWRSDDASKTFAAPEYADAVACTAVAGVVCEVMLGDGAVDTEAVLRVMRRPRNGPDIRLFCRASNALLSVGTAAPYVERARAIIEARRDAIALAVEQLSQHVCDVDARPGIGLPLPYEIPRSVYPAGLGRAS